MALGIYKQGQGYWVRVLTATGLGIITLATAGWLWGQMGVVASKLPRTTWSIQVDAPQGAPAVGERLSLLSRPERGSEAREIGTAEVSEFSAASGLLKVRNVTMTDPATDPSSAGSVAPIAGAGFKAGIRDKARGEASVQPVVLQGSAAIAVILGGFILTYWLTAMNRKFVEFLIATDMEMKKVNWSTRKDIIKSTMVVVFACVLIAGSLFAVDFTFQQLFRAMGVLTY